MRWSPGPTCREEGLEESLSRSHSHGASRVLHPCCEIADRLLPLVVRLNLGKRRF